MILLGRKVTLLDTNNKAELERKEKQLRDAGIKTNSWQTDSQPVIGCGAHMKPGDWSGKRAENKDEQRIVYHLEVKAADQYKAMKVLMGESAYKDENFIP